MSYLRVLSVVASTLLASAAAYCYSDSSLFETSSFTPDYTITSGGVISKNIHYPGFAIVNDGTPTSPNTGVSDEDYPYFIAFNLASQGSSANYAPAMQIASPATSLSLRTLYMACFEDKAGRSPTLPAVNCDITLTCYKGGRATASQTLSYTCGAGRDTCGAAGLRNAPMQAAALDVARFACCQKIGFSATPHTSHSNPVAVGFDTLGYYYSTPSQVSGASSQPDSACGCSA